MYNYFILGYQGIDYLSQWYDRSHFIDTNLYIIDNGNQVITEQFKSNIIYQTSKNIGCAGGWNLIFKIAFDYMGLDKIIVGQEDAMVSQDIFCELYDRVDDNNLIGTYNNGFTFSTYIITKNIVDKVGYFDENFLYAGCEDNDYQYRCKLNGIAVNTLGISNSYNLSLSNNTNVVDSKFGIHNANYINMKWNNYTYITPFNTGDSYYTDLFKDIYGYNDKLPSQIEYDLFIGDSIK
jgi:GT2 family glycosyltransferase